MIIHKLHPPRKGMYHTFKDDIITGCKTDIKKGDYIALSFFPPSLREHTAFLIEEIETRDHAGTFKNKALKVNSFLKLKFLWLS